MSVIELKGDIEPVKQVDSKVYVYSGEFPVLPTGVGDIGYIQKDRTYYIYKRVSHPNLFKKIYEGLESYFGKDLGDYTVYIHLPNEMIRIPYGREKGKIRVETLFGGSIARVYANGIPVMDIPLREPKKEKKEKKPKKGYVNKKLESYSDTPPYVQSDVRLFKRVADEWNVKKDAWAYDIDLVYQYHELPKQNFRYAVECLNIGLENYETPYKICYGKVYKHLAKESETRPKTYYVPKDEYDALLWNYLQYRNAIDTILEMLDKEYEDTYKRMLGTDKELENLHKLYNKIYSAYGEKNPILKKLEKKIKKRKDEIKKEIERDIGQKNRERKEFLIEIGSKVEGIKLYGDVVEGKMPREKLDEILKEAEIEYEEKCKENRYSDYCIFLSMRIKGVKHAKKYLDRYKREINYYRIFEDEDLIF